MKNIILLILILFSLIGCKSPQFTADTKAELALLCVEQFPQEELDRETDTIFEDKEVFIIKEIDCDSIGTKEVQIKVKYKDRVVKEIVTVRDTSKDFLVIMLQADKEVLEAQVKREQAELKEVKQSHKKELKDAKKQYKRLWGWIIGILGLGGLLIYIIKR